MTTNINPYQQPMGQPYMMNPVMVPQMQQSKAAQEVNAVKIELIEPKAYGSAPNDMAAQQPSCFSYPQTSVYAPNGMSYPYTQSQIYSSPVSMMTPPVFQPLNSTPDMSSLPSAVVDTPTSVQQPTVPPATAPAVEVPAAQPTVPPSTAPVVDTPVAQPATTQPQQPVEDVNTTLQELASTNLETQFNAINKIAEKVQAQAPEAANFLAVDTFKGLASVVNKDTTTLEAPTQEQTALREKALSGQQLTPEEQAKAEQLAPQEIAEMNKQYALYTLAILQNSYRDAVNKELQTQGMQPAKINELPEINLVIDTIKNNPNALIREAGISALSYVVRPEDKDVAKTVFTLATQDSDENVKKAASDALAKIGEPLPAAPVEAGKAEEANASKTEQPQENVKKEEAKAEDKKAA